MKGARALRYAKYRNEVRKHTEQNRPVRSYGMTLDHVVSVAYGFTHDIPAERIGSAENLIMLPFQENIQKGQTITAAARAILDRWENENTP